MEIKIVTADVQCVGYACPPAGKVDLPECEHGWEFGNNVVVCATWPPETSLAGTGGDMGFALGCWALAAALLCVGIALTVRGRRR